MNNHLSFNYLTNIFFIYNILFLLKNTFQLYVEHRSNHTLPSHWIVRSVAQRNLMIDIISKFMLGNVIRTSLHVYFEDTKVIVK